MVFGTRTIVYVFRALQGPGQPPRYLIIVAGAQNEGVGLHVGASNPCSRITLGNVNINTTSQEASTSANLTAAQGSSSVITNTTSQGDFEMTSLNLGDVTTS